MPRGPLLALRFVPLAPERVALFAWWLFRRLRARESECFLFMARGGSYCVAMEEYLLFLIISVISQSSSSVPSRLRGVILPLGISTSIVHDIRLPLVTA